jgi:uncharacterized protein GlcG (DUF336 family)
MKILAFVATVVCLDGGGLLAQPGPGQNANCSGLPTDNEIRVLLNRATSRAALDQYGMVGGLFGGARMWGAVVNRDGEVCAYNTSTTDRSQVWPGSQAIAKAKAYTANAFSLDDFALSTARLYTFTQPGHSLWSLGQSNLFDPGALAPPATGDGGRQRIAGGLIFFGGGLPIYRDGKIVGGLGVSGDTSCADHEIAKRVRDLAGQNPPGGMLADDIVYDLSVFAHPVCLNTYKNGIRIGSEARAEYLFEW